MKITNLQYAQALFDSVKAGNDKDRRAIISSFARFLSSRHDAYRLDRVISEFERLWNKEFGIVKAEANSFYPLDEKMIAVLSDYVKKHSSAKEVVTEFKIDKSILGGVVIKYGDKIFDGSLKARLNRLKERIIN